MIGIERDGHVVSIELQREQRRNALSEELLNALRVAIREAARDARVIVLTGQGTAFCAGADLNEVNSESFIDSLLATVRTLDGLGVPVIAAVNGPALGAGTQLAMACDLRVVAPDAYIGIPVAKLGLALDRWTVQRLCLLAGAGPARTMLFGAETIDADEALRLGFANRIGKLADARAWAEKIAALAPLTLRQLKLVLNDDGSHDGESPAQRAARTEAWLSRDAVEGIRAQLERRAATFTGK